jgi:hypothetical protein
VFSQNLTYVDNKPLHLGFSLGLNTMDFGVKNKLEKINGAKYYGDVSHLKPGFSVGIVSDLRLNNYFNLRLTPTLHFGDRSISYNQKTIKSVGGDSTLILGDRNITSIPICIPIFIKYRAERRMNYRPYLLWGVGSYFDLGRNKTNPVLLKTLDFYTEFGIGCDLYFSFFKLSPELKFGIGLNNILVPIEQRNEDSLSKEDKVFTNALSGLNSKFISLTFNFE